MTERIRVDSWRNLFLPQAVIIKLMRMINIDFIRLEDYTSPIERQ